MQVRALVKPVLGMFHGEPRGKKWRAAVSGRRQGVTRSYVGSCMAGARLRKTTAALSCKMLCGRLQVDAALKSAESVTEVLDATLPVLLPETLDAPPRAVGELPERLPHYAVELPPTADGLGSNHGPAEPPAALTAS